MTRLILASHGDLSKGMLNSVQMIVGNVADDIETYSLYPGENPNDYVAKLKEEIDISQDEYLIVCDIKGGSVYNAMVQLCVNERVQVISGMNMNLVLEIVIGRNAGNINLEQTIQNGKDGIEIENLKTLSSVIEEEDF